MLPLLTIIADFVGMFGGWVIAILFLQPALAAVLDLGVAGAGVERRGAGPAQAVRLRLRHFADRLLYGLRTTGGTQGVGRATTQAMVAATVLIFVTDLLITKIFVSQAAT